MSLVKSTLDNPKKPETCIETAPTSKLSEEYGGGSGGSEWDWKACFFRMTLKLNGDGAIAATKITPILNWPPFELGAAPTLRTDCSWCRRSTEESVQGLLVFAVFLRAWDQASTPAERDLQDLVHVHHVHNATNSIHLVWSLGKICARPQQSCDAQMNVVTVPPPSTNQVKSEEIWDRFQKTDGFEGDLCPTQTLLNWTSGFKGPWSLMSHMEEGSCVYLRTEASNQSQKGKPVFGREEHPTANTPFKKEKETDDTAEMFALQIISVCYLNVYIFDELIDQIKTFQTNQNLAMCANFRWIRVLRE